jgi:hypothetical protein
MRLTNTTENRIRKKLKAGVETSAKLDRYDLMHSNKDAVTRLMSATELSDSVGLVVDLRDFHGQQAALAVGVSEEQIEEAKQDSQEKRLIPTACAVVSRDAAKVLMPKTSPTGGESVIRQFTACDNYDAWPVIVIGQGGNTYAGFPKGVE